MPDVAHRFGEQRPSHRDLGRALDIGMARERTDAKRPVLHAQERERLDAVQVDQPVGAREPEVEERDEALAPGEHLDVLVLPREQAEHLVDLPRRLVGERRGLHGPAS